MLNNIDIRINWIMTLWINFAKLPFRQAWKLPILIYGWNNDIAINKIVLDIPSNRVKFAIIKIGCQFDVCTWSHFGSIIHSKGQIIIRGACVIGRGFSYWGGSRSFFVLGGNSVINGNCSIHCKESIEIGENFSCSWNVSISDTDFHVCRDMRTNVLCSESSPIVIGENVWIGQFSTIAKGSVIPKWTIISQRSLVNKKIECNPYSILVGSPARILSGRNLRREDMYERSQYCDGYLITKGFRLFNLTGNNARSGTF